MTAHGNQVLGGAATRDEQEGGGLLQGIEYDVDLVLCVDCTASMTPILEAVKATALGFHGHVTDALTAKDKRLSQLRVRVVGFRDVVDNGPQGLLCSEFFTLPADSQHFGDFVARLVPVGNTSYPESGLVGLAVAMHSDWARQGHRQRHVIVIWTDDQPNPLETDAPAVPLDYRLLVPGSLDALTELWEGQSAIMSHSAKRLLIFAPGQGPWEKIADSWENTILVPSVAGSGLADQEMASILDLIANSV